VQELGLICKPATFISTISNERGLELLYTGMCISNVFKEDIGLGGVVSLLWFKSHTHLFVLGLRL
jgi:ATP citrate (pro-S)-lyase